MASTAAAASAGNFTVRVRKFKTNPLLERKQFAVEVLHGTGPTVPLASVRTALAKRYKVSDPNTVILFGFKTAFGGGRTRGFGLIYDSIASCKLFEQRYRLARIGVAPKEKPGLNRRAKKDLRVRQKKVRGTDKVKLATAGKK